MKTPTKWSIEEALVLIRQIEEVCQEAGCHVALTGGVLYKDGFRKDLDLLFYRIRQRPSIDMEVLIQNLTNLGLYGIEGKGWLFKARYKGKNLDIFFPEESHMHEEFQYGNEWIEEETAAGLWKDAKI